MNFKSGAFIGNDSLALYNGRDTLLLLRDGCEPRILTTGYEDIRYLSASRYGEYVAFWSITGESFRLIDSSGHEIWSEWMNSDKVTARDTQFSYSGDALACAFYFEGVPGLFLCDIDRGYSTRFGCSNSPIGYDAGLRYFLIDRFDPYEDEKLAYYKRDVVTGNPVKLSPDEVNERMKKKPLVFTRDRCIVPTRRNVPRDWDAAAIKITLDSFVILKDGDLHWIDENPTSFDTTIQGCLTKEEQYKWRQCTLDIDGNIALIQSASCNSAKAFHRYHGLVWQGENCSSAILGYNQVAAKYTDGTIGTKRINDRTEMKFKPSSGSTIVAVDMIDNVLYVAKIGRKFEIKKFFPVVDLT
jgi:hypothetical protein